jgi:hypothetical protein
LKKNSKIPKDKVEEMSSTGGGAPAADQGHVTPGDGEGVATRHAFGGAGGTKAKRKKGILVTKKIGKWAESIDLASEYKRLFKKGL